MLEALQRSLDEESEGRKAEAAARAAAQERCSVADEQLTKLERESNQAAASLQRKVCHPLLPHIPNLAADNRKCKDDTAQSFCTLLTSLQLKSSGSAMKESM